MTRNGLTFVITAIIAFGLTACASTVDRKVSSWQYQGQKFASLRVSLNDAAKEKLKDNIKFDAQRFEQNILRTMESRGLIDKSSKNAVDVEVSDIRVRSTFSAVMWGFMAGNDHVSGTVRLKHPAGVMHTFDVSASYALGGLGGGQDESRMNWLYEEFAKLTVNEIMNGETQKTASGR